MLWSKEDTWTPLFKSVGESLSVEPALLMGLAAMESGFNPQSYREEPSIYKGPGANPGEHVASWGLMQTTQEAAVEGGWPRTWPFTRLYEPELSITYGAKELKRYLSNPVRNVTATTAPMVVRVNNTADAVAAYNAGFPRSIRFTTAYIAKIYSYPFPEYRDNPPKDWRYANEMYVRRVLTYTEYFRAKLAGRLDAAKAIEVEIKKKAYHAVPSAIGAGLLLLLGAAVMLARGKGS